MCWVKIELRESHGDCDPFSESDLSDGGSDFKGRGDFDGSVDLSEGLTE